MATGWVEVLVWGAVFGASHLDPLRHVPHCAFRAIVNAPIGAS